MQKFAKDMDEFGVLTEHYGLKPQGKSAPMAASKRSTTANNGANRNFGVNSKSTSTSSWNSSSVNGSSFNNNHGNSGVFDDYDIFGDLHKSSKQSNNHGNNNTSFNYDSIFSTNSSTDNDIFAGMPGVKKSASVHDDNEDIFGSFASSTKQNDSVDDLLGNFGGIGLNPKSSSFNGSGNSGKNSSSFDDLLSGFGGSSTPSYGKNVETTKSTFMPAGDPFVVLESTSSTTHTSSDQYTDPLEEFSKFSSSGSSKHGGSSHAVPILRPPPRPPQGLKADKVKSSSASSVDELEDFAMGRPRNTSESRSDVHHAREVRERQNAKGSRYKEAEDAAQETQHNSFDDLESFFHVDSRSSSVPKSRATTPDPMFDADIFNKVVPEVPKRNPPGSSFGAKKAFPPKNVEDDLTSIFGGSPWPQSGEKFQEVEGESEERRRARWERHQRTQNRLAQAVADLNQRDVQTQNEQEERRRIADTLDIEIKRWAAGKEGNMRALLSSLHIVLWPGCGWEAVSLTDLITSTSVKKAYRKATLFVHPDKVQQKGATLQQKYTAEKVFDILKEAYNKFNSEELS